MLQNERVFGKFDFFVGYPTLSEVAITCDIELLQGQLTIHACILHAVALVSNANENINS